jgi:uncharacterized protein YigE (DUF2233 family)
MKRTNISLIIITFLQIIGQLIYAGDKIKIYQSIYNQVETPIAVNPTDPKNLIVGVINMDNNQYRVGVFYTDDGGESWHAIEQLGNEGAADPKEKGISLR